MAFRDDREALRQQNESLQHELDSTERELAEKRERAEEADRLEKELKQAQARIDRLEGRPRPQQGRALTVVAAAGAAMVVLAAGVAYLIVHEPAVVPLAGGLVAPGAPVVTSPGATATAAPPEPRQVERVWTGKVQRAEGMKLAAGTPCRVLATLRYPKGSPTVEIECGGKFLYRSTDQLEGMSSTSSGHAELPGGAAGQTRHSLAYQDQGSRTGARTQASINSPQNAAAAWSESAPAFRVDIALDELSAPGPALDPTHTPEALPFAEAVQRKGKVEAVTGTAPVAAGAACELTLTPSWGKPGCRARVRCGEEVLYGAGSSGYLECEVAGGKATRARDTVQDGDPAVDIDLVGGEMVVDDRTQASPYTATIALSPAGPRP